MKKLIRGGAIICSSAVLLASCSNSGSDSKESNSEKIHMGDILSNKNEHISYILTDDNPIEKNTNIDFYVVTKDGKAKVYDGTGDTTLGDVAKMDDKKIKERMAKEDKEWFKKDKKETLDALNEGIDKVAEIKKGYHEKKSDGEKGKKAYEYTKKYIDEHGNVPQKAKDKIEKTKYTEPKFSDLKISAKTDGSGNETEKETFKFKAHGFKTTGVDQSEDYDSQDYYFTDSSVQTSAKFENDLNLTEEYEDTVAVTDIFDKKYAGLSMIDEDDEDKVNYIVTEVGDKAKEVKMDSPKAKYIDKVD